jgi:hypothetical protein
VCSCTVDAESKSDPKIVSTKPPLAAWTVDGVMLEMVWATAQLVNDSAMKTQTTINERIGGNIDAAPLLNN